MVGGRGVEDGVGVAVGSGVGVMQDAPDITIPAGQQNMLEHEYGWTHNDEPDGEEKEQDSPSAQ